MKKSDLLRQQRAAVQQKIDALLDTAETEKRSLTAEEVEQMKTLRTERDAFNPQIEAETMIEEEKRAKMERNAAPAFVKNPDKGEKRTKAQLRREFSFVRAINARVHHRELDGIEKEVIEEGRREMRSAKKSPSADGITLPVFFMADTAENRADIEQRAQSVGTTTQSGHLVATEIGEVIEYLHPRTVVREMGAQFWTGLTSNVDLVRQDGAAAATWEGENDDNANTDPTVENVPLRPKRLGASTIIGKQLIFQTESISVENWIRNELNTAQGVALETALLNGSGTAPVPEGLLNMTGIGDVAIGTNGGAPTWLKILELETNVADNNAEFGTLGYLTTAVMRGKLKGTEQFGSSNGRPIWEGNIMNGYSARISTILPKTLVKGTSSDCHPIIYGNWAEMYVAQWDNIDLVVDPYTLAAKAQIKLVLNGWYDVVTRHPQSFAAIQDARNV